MTAADPVRVVADTLLDSMPNVYGHRMRGEILRAKAEARGESERISHAEAETRAEADDTVGALYLDRLNSAALADSHREKLRQLKEQQANGRTAVASSRVVDQMHADGSAGAA